MSFTRSPASVHIFPHHVTAIRRHNSGKSIFAQLHNSAHGWSLTSQMSSPLLLPPPSLTLPPLQPQSQGGQTQPESGPPQQGAVSQSRTSVTGEVPPPFFLIFLLTPQFVILAPHICLLSSQILSSILAPYFPLLVIFFSLLTPNFSLLTTYSSVFPPCSSLLTYLPTFPTSLLSSLCPLHSSLLTPTISPSLSTLRNFTL